MKRIILGSLLATSSEAFSCFEDEPPAGNPALSGNGYTPPEGWKCAHDQATVERSADVLVKCDSNGTPTGPHDEDMPPDTPGTGGGGMPPGDGEMPPGGGEMPPGGGGQIPPDTHPFPHLIAFQPNWSVQKDNFEPGTPNCEKLKHWDLIILAFYVNYNYVDGGPMDCKTEMKPFENAWLFDSIEKCTGRRPGVAIFGWNNRNCIKDITSAKLNEQVIAMYQEFRPRVIHIDYLIHAELLAGDDVETVKVTIKEQNTKIISLVKTLKAAEPHAQVMFSANAFYMNHPDYVNDEGLDVSHVIKGCEGLLLTVDPLYYGAATKDINSPADLSKHKEQTDMYHNSLGQRCCVGVEGTKIPGSVADFARAATENQVQCFTYWSTDTQDTHHDGDDWAKVMREVYVGAGINLPDPNTAPNGTSPRSADGGTPKSDEGGLCDLEL